jgi:hypothetical protein
MTDFSLPNILIYRGLLMNKKQVTLSVIIILKIVIIVANPNINVNNYNIDIVINKSNNTINQNIITF